MKVSIHNINIEKITKAMLFHQGEPFATSLQIANHFGIRHDDLLRKIRSFDSFGQLVSLRKIAEQNRIERGREYPYFELDADAYAFICLSITGKRAEQFKWIFLEAFKKATADAISARVAVEQNRINNEWLLSRKTAKDTRMALQVKIKEFCLYAEVERGEHYDCLCPYYKHITDAIYNYIGVKVPKSGQSPRDIYTGDIIEAIEDAEDSVIEFLDQLMNTGGTRKGIKLQITNWLLQRVSA